MAKKNKSEFTAKDGEDFVFKAPSLGVTPTLKAINDGEELPTVEPVVEVDAPELDAKELAKSIKDEFRKVEDKVEKNAGEYKAPAESAMSIIDEAADKGDPVVLEGGFETEFQITKGTAERLANRLNEIPKNSSIDLKTLVETVCDQVEKLHREKSRRSQQNTRTIAELRANDAKGIRTCGRCAYRVNIDQMDSKKELCEVCAS